MQIHADQTIHWDFAELGCIIVTMREIIKEKLISNVYIGQKTYKLLYLILLQIIVDKIRIILVMQVRYNDG